MHRLANVLKFGGIILGILFAGVLAGWLATKKPVADSPAPTNDVPPLKPAANEHVAFFPTKTRTHTNHPGNDLTSPAPAATNVLADWENKLDDILTSDLPEPDKAKQLLEMFPRLPEDGKVEVAQHLSNLVADQDYEPLGKLLRDSKLSEPVLDVLVMDVLNRPNSLKLPVLLDVARDPQHPKASEAKDLLELYLEEDYGTDWNKWQAKLEQWIKDNPD